MYSGRIDVRQCRVKIENFLFVLFKGSSSNEGTG